MFAVTEPIIAAEQQSLEFVSKISEAKISEIIKDFVADCDFKESKVRRLRKRKEKSR